MKYANLKPSDRIRKLIEEFIEPNLSEHGFKLLKSKLTFKRTKGNFTQEIHISKNRWNIGDSVVSFWTVLFVKSNFYVKWHTETYGFKPMNEIIDSWYDNDIKEWNSEYWDGGQYDLTQFDNIDLMNDFNKNILNVGIPLLDKTSDWESAADYLMEKEHYGSISKIFDFYIIANKKEKAVNSLETAERYFQNVGDVPQERFKEIELKKDYLQQRITKIAK